MYKIKLKKFLFKKFPNFYKILFIIKNNIFFKKNYTTFSGWGLETKLSLPWEKNKNIQNKTSTGFIVAKDKLDKKIKNKEFFLSQIENHFENTTFNDVIRHFNELTYRHYVVYYSALTAFENTNCRNIVECGVAEGMTIFFALDVFSKDKNYKAYLYDSWQSMRENELKTAKDLKRKGNYNYLNIDITKNNLNEFNSNLVFNKGFVPEIFGSCNNPKNISWLHIDLNSSYATYETLNFFYDKLEKNGIILFDDYAHNTYDDTKAIVEDFFKNKNINFLQFMTGQAMVTKKNE